jgi:hypothetical protein
MAHLEGQRIVVNPRIDEGLRDARRGSDRLAGVAPMQIEKDRAGKRPAFVGEVESDKGKPIDIGTPDSHEPRSLMLVVGLRQPPEAAQGHHCAEDSDSSSHLQLHCARSALRLALLPGAGGGCQVVRFRKADRRSTLLRFGRSVRF